MHRFVSDPVTVPRHERAYYRADLEFEEPERFGASFVGLVLLGNPDAGADAPATAEHGYAGRFTVFGHEVCFGDEGHIATSPNASRSSTEIPSTP